jgi:Mn2+/Fe2+ NRAMP family transporter
MHISGRRLHWFGLPSLIIIVLSVIAVAILLGLQEDLRYADPGSGLAPAVMVVVLIWILSITIVGAVVIAAHIYFAQSDRPQ